VVTARLRDARFFWDADRRIGLEGRLTRLETVLFHKDLGSYRQKTERIEKLAGWLVEHVMAQPEAVATATRAARLSKADLATDMVREFTELQGTRGGIYAREAGEPEAVWKAIYHHYLPTSIEPNAAPTAASLGAGATAWAAVSLADKLDTLVGLFLAGERPTGSRDPFGLRRHAHGIIRILLDGEALTKRRLRVPLWDLVRQAAGGYDKPFDEVQGDLRQFLVERLQFVLESRGFDRRNVRAVLGSAQPLEKAALVDVEANLTVLREHAATPAFRKLAEMFKRVRNIGKDYALDAFERDEQSGPALDSVLEEAAEKALLSEIDRRHGPIKHAVATGGGFREAYVEASELQPIVARFFEEVFVMSDDARLRQARLRLMKRLELLILQLGDISEIVASE
jgi:glycyl-tRNA synthetase beta chain